VTDQPDTAEILASLNARGTIGPLRTYDLCDALDEARAERDRARDEWDGVVLLLADAENRAEAAEARAAILTNQVGFEADRADIAEARIAAALASYGIGVDCPNGWDDGEPGCGCHVCEFRRALTGRTP
jgi:hypothetical protein